jgi:hypothetical protein
VLAPGAHLARVTISRDKIKYASGTAVVHAGKAKFRLHSMREMKRAHYLITIVITHGNRTSAIRYRELIR